MPQVQRLNLRRKLIKFSSLICACLLSAFCMCDVSYADPKVNDVAVSVVDDTAGYNFMLDRSRSDEELLITNLLLGDVQLLEVLLVYEDFDTGKFYIPLRDVLEALKFPITVDEVSGVSKGWFVDKKRVYELDLKAGKVRSDGKVEDVSIGDVELHEDGIYVSLDAFSRWFPLTAEMDYGSLSVVLKSLEPLPIEVIAARDKRHSSLKNKNKREQKEFREVEDVKAPAFSIPYVDTSAQTSYSNSDAGQKRVLTSFSTQATGIVLGQDTKLSLNDTVGDEGKPDVRIKMSRKDVEGDLLGIGLSEYEFGDVNIKAIPFLARSNSGRGVSFSNRSLDHNNGVRTNTVELRGDLPVGYQVDIVKDGQLIGFVDDSDENGEYVFEADVFPGLNIFELVFYGPQGQKEVKNERVFVPVNPVDKGVFGFNVGVVQDSKKLFTNDGNGTDENKGKNRITVEAEYGIDEKSSIYTALASVPMDGKRKQYGLMNYSRSFKGVRVDLSYARSNDKAEAMGVSFQSVFYGLRLKADHNVFYDFVSEETEQAGLQGSLKYNSSVGVSGLLPMFKNIPFSLKLDRLENTLGVTRNDLQARITKNIKKIRVTAQYNHRDQSDLNTANDVSMQVSSRYQDFTLRGAVLYSFQPDSYLKNVNFNADWHYDDSTSFQLGLRHSGGNNPINSALFGASHDFQKFKLGMNVSYNNEDEVLAVLSSSFSFGYDPLEHSAYFTKDAFADSAVFVPRVFYDTNNNQLFDDEDEWLQDVTFTGTGVGKTTKTNNEGYAFLDVPSYKRSSINISSSSLSDPFLYSNPDIKDYVLRPGQTVRKDFPVIMVGEADGQVYAFSRGKRVAAQSIGVQVLSKDGSVVAQGSSEYDGFVLIDKVPVGEYSVRLDPEQLEELGYCPSEMHEIALNMDDPYSSIDDFTLWPRGHEDRVIVSLGRSLPQEKANVMWAEIRPYMSDLFLEQSDVPYAYLMGVGEPVSEEEGLFDLVLYDVDPNSAGFICDSLQNSEFKCEVLANEHSCSNQIVEIDQVDLAANTQAPAEDLEKGNMTDLTVEEIEKIIGN